MNKEIKCSNCIKFKTPYCPCTIDCMATDDYPYFQDRFMLLEENHQLKDRLQQKDNAIDKYTKWLKLNIKIYENRVMEHGFDDDEIIMNCYQNALEKLQQMKGGCDVKN